MTLRLPQSISRANAFNALEYELASERADALGRQGRKAEDALARLAAWSADHGQKIDRKTLLDEACDAVWSLFIQREICGLHNNRDVIDRYKVPGEVLARLGAARG